jgi:hypothetical protein
MPLTQRFDQQFGFHDETGRREADSFGQEGELCHHAESFNLRGIVSHARHSVEGFHQFWARFLPCAALFRGTGGNRSFPYAA